MTASRTKTVEPAGPEAPVRQPSRAPRPSAPTRPTPLARGLSVTAGNLATQRLLRAGATQPTAIGSPRDDPAARAAVAVMSHAPMLSRQPRCTCGGLAGPGGECAECRASRLMQKPEGARARPAIAPPIVHRVLGSDGGQPLDPALRQGFEARLGHDLAGVRLHVGGEAAESARAVNARAYSVGQDIVFGSGAYAPGTDSGQRLLAHELTHTIQQSGSRPVGLSRALEVGAADDAPEREAEAVANAISPLGRPTGRERQPSPAPGPSMVRRSWYDPFVEGAEWLGGRAADVGEAAWGGAKWVGGKVAAGAEATWEGAQWVGGKAVDVGEAAWEGGVWLVGKARKEARRVAGAAWACAKATGRSAWNILTLDVSSLSDLLGVPEPKGAGAPGILDHIISIVQHPCLQMIPGYSLVAGIVAKLPGLRAFLSTAWEVMQNPSIVLDALQAALGGLIAEIPGKARALTRAAITFSEPRPDHLEGIWRHLEPKLDYLAGNWWEVIKQTGWDLLWPWPGVAKNFGEIWDHLNAAGSALWDLDFSGAVDHLNALWRKSNEALGRLYGWFFLASVLVGTIVGAVGGGPAGALVGAAAGAKFALLVGQGLLISTIAAETISIAKAGYDLTYAEQTPEEKEEDYEQIANSGLTLAITGAMFLLGALAARFASAIISRVAARVWQRPALRGSGTTSRGDIIEVRVATSALVVGMLRRRAVTWLETVRRNFPVIDILDNGQIVITPRPGRAPLYQVNGGRLISVKSTQLIGADAQAAIRGWVDDLAGFTTVRNVTVSNPTGRTLIVAVENPLDQAAVTALNTYATAQGVTIEMFTHLPPNHPAVIFPDAIPAIMTAAGVVASEEATEEVTVEAAAP